MRKAASEFEDKVYSVSPRKSSLRARSRREKEESHDNGRFYINKKNFLSWHEKILKTGELHSIRLIDKGLEVDLEVEKLLVFVHKTLGHTLDYLTAMSVPTFFQLLREADAMQQARRDNG